MTIDHERSLDDTDWRLLQALQADARLAYSELGRRVGLSPPAVAERVRGLEEAGVITGYRAEVNLEKIGLPLLTFIRVATDERTCGKFGNVVKEIPEVLECHRVTGGDSYIVKAAVSSVQHLEDLLNRLATYGQTVTALAL